MSQTKYYLTEKEIESIIINYFGKETQYSISVSNEGSFNVIYIVHIENNRDYILKVAPSANKSVLIYENNILETEATMLRLLNEAKDIPSPSVLLFDNKRVLCKSDYILMEKLDGFSLASLIGDIDSNTYNDIMYCVGKINRQINSYTGTYFGYPNNKDLQGDKWDLVFFEMLKSCLCDASRLCVDLGISQERIINACKKSLFLLREVKQPHLIHWDLWDGNILVNNGRISGVIDFERALWGDPLMEYFFNGIVDGSSNKYFLSGYGKMRFSKEELIKRSLYNIYMFIIMIVDQVNRHLEDSGTLNWACENLKKMVEYLEDN